MREKKREKRSKLQDNSQLQRVLLGIFVTFFIMGVNVIRL
jgi:hypothetical protein